MRVWRGDAEGGELKSTTRSSTIRAWSSSTSIHRIQATQQAGDLAVRWNCKAGKCGSCSAEINGKPRLMCMTRMNVFPRTRPSRHADEDVPADRDLVTDVSSTTRRRSASRRSRRAARRRRHLPDDAESTSTASRSSASASSASCARTSATSSATTRRTRKVRRPALLHPPRRARHAPARHRRPRSRDPQEASARATATSPSAAPRSAPSTSTSPTTASSR
jgi:succinate dehydrogenase/fumarate reductase-like Fe-S protein